MVAVDLRVDGRQGKPAPCGHAVFGRARLIVALLASLPGVLLVACRDDDGEPTPAPTSATASAVASPTASPTPSPTPEPPTSTPSATPRASTTEPLGFPLDPETRVGVVEGEVGQRTLRFDPPAPTALEYSQDAQPSPDPAAANASGWNCRVHVEYEDLPAVDWYIPAGTPIIATMAGTATLLVNTVSNPFDVYGVSREPYIGNPDRARAPISPFPGPGGGQGVFIRIEGAGYRTDYAHLDLAATMTGIVPASAWLSGYQPGQALIEQFTPLRDFRVATAVARWEVNPGDVIGFSGDSGYSEAPHLHYTVQSLAGGSATYLCPTAEPGFADAGWLFR